MRIVSLLIICLLSLLIRNQGHPHGPAFKVSCSLCHSTKGWQLDKEIYSYDHNTARFSLEGQHLKTDCRLCHPTLIFSEAKRECNECHNDIHQATTGQDCSRCHSPVSWLVENITEIHQMSRFPLLGAHRAADCYDCHKSETLVRFDVTGINCIDCHRSDFNSTTNPNHIEAAFAEDCSICHPVNALQWAGAGFNHNFFPLTLGHSGPACLDCHTAGNYTSTSPDCITCHQANYNSTTNPNHLSLGFSTVCTLCHTTNPGWKPAGYTEHDAKSFPIYSGKHRGTWDSCTDCHTNTASYSQFSCITCHEHNKAEMDSQHRDENGYSYDSNACFVCHPRGNSD